MRRQPSLVIINPGETKIHKYNYTHPVKTITVGSVEKFIREFREGKAPEYPKTASEPA